MRHKKGLGYRCDEMYSIGHRCKLQELQVVVSREKEREPKINADEEARSEGSEEGDHVVVELSVNSVIRLSSPKTMKLRGEIKGEGVIVMIDPGTTHNFISVELVRKLGISELWSDSEHRPSSEK